MTPLRAPRRPGWVWAHIDRFDKRGSAVWAVQECPLRGRTTYRTATHVKIRTPMDSLTLLPRGRRRRAWRQARQPIAFFQGPARVEWRRAVAWILPLVH